MTLRQAVAARMPGRCSPSHEARWPKPKMNIGDELRVSLVEADQADEPTLRQTDEGAVVEKERRKYFEILKKEYEELKKDFDPDDTEESSAKPLKYATQSLIAPSKLNA